ncbi:MAG: TIGR00725 family protein [Thermodesulfobacteriota bacterium]|nr:TIGR00725 family protein [Thermodesulfobacteriota bacterium]
MASHNVIGVIGAAECSKEIEQLAYTVGKEIAKRKAILVCGGMGGVMEAACRGAKSQGGITVGILPGKDKHEGNPFIDIPIITDMGHARNVLVVRSSDILIAISGSYGTLSEIAIALKVKKNVIGIDTWDCNLPIIKVDSPNEAVEKAISLIP